MRLGLDIGAKSIGWWLYETDGPESDAQITGVIGGGVRIFSDGRDPKSGASRAVDRRMARSMRRRRDRYLRRRATLMKVMADVGLMPSDPSEAKKLEMLDPYELRARGLDEELPLTYLGRALFHINQRRGFKSNRKTDRGNNERGKIKVAAARLDVAMMEDDARTYGEFLHNRRKRFSDPRFIPSVRTRLSTITGDDGDEDEAGYEFYPYRRHLEDEFNSLWEQQKSYNPLVLTEELRNVVFEKIFFQRPLKEPKIGLCLLTGETRLPRAHPLAQRRVLYETVNHLRVEEDGQVKRKLTLDERDAAVAALDGKKHTKSPLSMSITLNSLAKLLNLPKGSRFTLQTAQRNSISCDPVFATMSHPENLGCSWSNLSYDKQWETISKIRETESDVEYQSLIEWLMATHCVGRECAENVANAQLPEGYTRIGLTATARIFENLKSDVVTYSEAVEMCGWHHSDLRSGKAWDTLLYYGEVLDRHVIPGTGKDEDDDVTKFGRITNPTVHIGLNQLRRVVNKIIEVYGKPTQIVVELARELKQSREQKQQINSTIRENTKAAIIRGEKLMELGQENNGYNRMLLRLWEDLGPAIGQRRCPYTGETISATMLFDGSCEVDHILPFSRTLDDSFSNRTLCLSRANREKSNRTPWEVWGNTPSWTNIEANLANLKENKRWRFAPDSMKRFEEENSFLHRALVDTQYLSRIARTYLDTLYEKGGHVWVIPGRMTEKLRRSWGLNSLLQDSTRDGKDAKNRTDLRHHAIDAAVVGATDRALINRLAKAAGEGEAAGNSAERIARSIEPPWQSFRADIKEGIDAIIVSHRPKRGIVGDGSTRSGMGKTTGKLHNETAYGIVNKREVVSRIPFLSLSKSDIATFNKGKNIRDSLLQRLLQEATENKDGADYVDALMNFSSQSGPYCGIRRVRVVETIQEQKRVEIKSALGYPYKAYKSDSNECYELWLLPNGKVEPQVVTTFDANSQNRYKPHPAAKRVLRIFKRDMVEIDHKGRRSIFYVQKLDLKGGLYLVSHNEANADARHRDKQDKFKFLVVGARAINKCRLLRVTVDEIGMVQSCSQS